ncbi:MAG: glycosyltransferase [Actinomycetota bacterium]|nr:glycosyltransferase [Actinomycetota bacterium]
MSTLVSVVIPTHNRAALLRKAIDSVLAQTHQEFEIIVVDNGSTDETREMVGGYVAKDARVRYHYQENSGSPVSPRNKAAALARGTYLAFLDSDDLWLRDKLARQLAKFAEEPDTAIVYSDFYMMDKDGGRGANFFSLGQPHRGQVFPRLLVKNFIPTSTAMIKKTAFAEAGGMDERYRIAHDIDLYLKIASKYPVDYCDQPLAQIRMDASSLSGNRALLFEEIIDVTKKWEDKATADPRIGRRRYTGILARYYFRAGVYRFLDGDRRVAKDYLRQAVRHSPLDAVYFLSYLVATTVGWAAVPIFRFAGRNKGVFVK